MKHPRITVAAIVVAVGAAAGGLAIASAAGGASASGPARIDQATLHTASARVNGKSELILVDAKGEPLYTFKADTPTASHVRGQLAALWPPLVSAGTPRASGANGTLTTVSTPNGRQVAYNGHFLYSFVDDTPGHVTGQGVQDFFVATPGAGASATTTAPAATAPSSRGYGY